MFTKLGNLEKYLKSLKFISDRAFTRKTIFSFFRKLPNDIFLYEVIINSLTPFTVNVFNNLATSSRRISRKATGSDIYYLFYTFYQASIV